MKRKEIKHFFERERIVFDVAGEEFFIPKEDWLRLLNPRYCADEFEARIEPEDRIDDLDRIEIVAQYYLLANRHGLPIEETAKRMQIPAQKLRNWVTRHRGFINRLLETKRDDINALMARYEADESRFRKE